MFKPRADKRQKPDLTQTGKDGQEVIPQQEVVLWNTNQDVPKSEPVAQIIDETVDRPLKKKGSRTSLSSLDTDTQDESMEVINKTRPAARLLKKKSSRSSLVSMGDISPLVDGDADSGNASENA